MGRPFPHKIVPFHGGSGTPSNTWFLGTIWAYNPNGILIGSTVFAQMTAKCPYTLQWDAPSPSKLFLSMGDLQPHLIHDFLGPPEPITQMASWSVQPFLHRWPQSVPILCNGTPLPPQNCPFPWGDLDSHLIHGSLGQSKSSTQTASRSLLPFLQCSLVLTDRPTDRPRYSVGNNRPHLRMLYGWCGLTIITAAAAAAAAAAATTTTTNTYAISIPPEHQKWW